MLDPEELAAAAAGALLAGDELAAWVLLELAVPEFVSGAVEWTLWTVAGLVGRLTVRRTTWCLTGGFARRCSAREGLPGLL